MIVCWRTVQVPKVERDRFMAWIEENRRLREAHGILFELVLGRSARQNPTKTLQTLDVESSDEGDLVVVTAWSSHDAFDAWIETPGRDRLTDSEVHRSVDTGPSPEVHPKRNLRVWAELESWLTRCIQSADWHVERGVQDDRAYHLGRRIALADLYRQLQRPLGSSEAVHALNEAGPALRLPRQAEGALEFVQA